MKAVIKEEEAKYFVSEAEMVHFISENSNMGWNKVCDYIKKEEISGWNGESALWQKKDVMSSNAEKDYNINAVKWIRHFFEAHPFMNSFMLVFDD